MSPLRFDELLRNTHAGEPWYGPSRAAILSGLSAREAAAHPIPAAHSIWELVLHMTAWTHEVRRRLSGAPPGTPPEGDWPPVGDTSDAGWAAALAELDKAHAALAAAVAPLSEQALARPVGDGRDPTVAATLTGLAQHDAYHSGQIALLRRALRKG